MSSPPDLADRSILVTRAAEQAGEMAAQIHKRGGSPILMPVVEVRFLETPIELEGADYLILTSANAAEAVRRKHSLVDTPVICVGAKTEAALGETFTGPRQVPEVFRAEGVLGLLDEVEGRRFVIPRGAHGRELLLEALADRGAIVDAPIVYEVRSRPIPPEELEAARAADVVTFLSGATIEAFIERAGAALLEGRAVAVIGPVAKERAEALGIAVDVVPERATVEDLLDAIARHPLRRKS